MRITTTTRYEHTITLLVELEVKRTIDRNGRRRQHTTVNAIVVATFSTHDVLAS